MLIPDLENIVLEYANIKKINNKYLNKCNLCSEYKKQYMKSLDLGFYLINLSFVWNKYYNHFQDTNFQKMLEFCEITETMTGFVINSLYIEEYWLKNKKNSIEDILCNRIEYYDFLSNNFEFIEKRNLNICNKCLISKKKIKYE